MQITTEAKRAIINCLQNAAYANEDAQPLFEALNDAFFPLTSISAVYTQTETVTSATPLNDLKTDLVVTATYEGGDTEVLADNAYTLSGTLATGTSTVTVSYSGFTTTFNVTVSASEAYITDGLIHRWDGIDNTGSGHNSSATAWADLVGDANLTITGSITWGDSYASFPAIGTTGNYMRSATDKATTAAGKTVEIVIAPDGTDTATVAQLSNDNAAYGKITVYSDNTVGVKGDSGYTYETGVSSITGVKHIGAVFGSSPTTQTVYVNGAAVSLSSKSHSMRYANSCFVVGGSMRYTTDTQAGYSFKGKVYAIRIYDRNLSADEIAQNYATDVSRFSL